MCITTHHPPPFPKHTSNNLPQVSGEREFFAQMVVDAVTALDPGTLDLKMVGMKKVRERGGKSEKDMQ